MPYKDPQMLKQAKNDSQMRRRYALKLRVLEYLEDHPCVDCGEADHKVLDFDHIDRETKTKPIGLMINNRAKWETILTEIEKCEVRCANCHRRRTWDQLGHWKHLESYRS